MVATKPKTQETQVKPISQQQVQAETVQQVALQQIQQTMPQVNILQAAVSSGAFQLSWCSLQCHLQCQHSPL